MKQIRTCVVGVGFIGVVHIEAIRRLGFVEVVALCSLNDPAGLAKRLCVPKGYEDYKKMIDEEKPDVIHICTPNASHYEIARYALTHGIHVLCEKPLAYTVEEAEELEELVQQTGLVGGVNLHCRYYPMVREMRELIVKQELGEIFSVHGGYFQDWLLWDTDYSWRLKKSLSGSTRAVADIGSHWIDAAEFVTGRRIVRVMADFGIFHKTRKKPQANVTTFANKITEGEMAWEEFTVDTEDYAQVLLQFDNGAKGDMIVTQAFAGRKNQMVLSVAGARRAACWDSENLNELWIGERSTYNHVIVKDPSILQPGAARINSYPGGHVEGFADAFLQNFSAFYEMVRNQTPGCFASFHEGAREMRICEAIARSAEKEQWISIE